MTRPAPTFESTAVRGISYRFAVPVGAVEIERTDAPSTRSEWLLVDQTHVLLDLLEVDPASSLVVAAVLGGLAEEYLARPGAELLLNGSVEVGGGEVGLLHLIKEELAERTTHRFLVAASRGARSVVCIQIRIPGSAGELANVVEGAKKLTEAVQLVGEIQ